MSERDETLDTGSAPTPLGKFGGPLSEWTSPELGAVMTPTTRFEMDAGETAPGQIAPGKRNNNQAARACAPLATAIPCENEIADELHTLNPGEDPMEHPVSS